MPSSHFRRALEEGWANARHAKDQRRAENRAKWSERRDWSDDNQHKVDTGTPAEPIADDDAMTSASLKRLRRTMLDNRIPLRRRLDCAEVVLSYELGPGAAAGADPETIAAVSYQFLKLVADDPDAPEALSFRALRLVAQVENARAQVRNTAEQLYEKRALLVGLANAERRRHLLSIGKWPPPEGVHWLDVSDAIPLPSSWIAMQWPLTSISASYQRGDVEAFRAQLRSIRATNRDDRFWDEFSPDAA
jgi:hypothetical protein